MSCSNITGVLQRDRTNKSLRELKARKKLYKINFLHLKKRGGKKKKKMQFDVAIAATT